MNFELMILDGIQQIRSGLLDSIMVFITHLGDAGAMWIVIAVVLLLFKKTRKLGIACCIALICSLLITNLGLKNLVGRARPYNYRDMTLLIKEPHDFSFPSGHTSAAFSVAYILMIKKFKIKKWHVGITAIVFASLMAFTRLYIYVHFPSDIIASLLIGLLCSVIGMKVADKVMKDERNY